MPLMVLFVCGPHSIFFTFFVSVQHPMLLRAPRIPPPWCYIISIPIQSNMAIEISTDFTCGPISEERDVHFVR
ncbi:hypothetical protein Q7C36_009362 [Tachysurus vachellii]|uniref:Uncharacterized protein n=1 Tax=Tachysurus vachellii TaxID=175792 RepID=A0AA88STB9_TACVA|nr:hypothetical protein Q7C36_009362 [Tachysurus vachellii]